MSSKLSPTANLAHRPVLQSANAELLLKYDDNFLADFHNGFFGTESAMRSLQISAFHISVFVFFLCNGRIELFS